MVGVNKRTVDISGKSALIVVDIQNDFLPGGALAVPDGDKIIPVVNEYISIFEEKGVDIFATRDWHPEDHISFTHRGGPWPPHCVQNTYGAQFHPDLKLPERAHIISKADQPDKEAYSGFEGTNLAEELKQREIEALFICGLATDYCVKNTVLDAIKNGFKVYLLVDAIRGIDPVGSEKAIQEMKEAGAQLITIEDVKSPLEKIKETVDKVAKESIDEISKKVEEVTEKIEEVVKEKIEETKKKILHAVRKGEKDIEKRKKRISKSFEEATKSVTEGLKKTVENVAKMITQAAEKIRKEVGVPERERKPTRKPAPKKAKAISPRREKKILREEKKRKGGVKPMAAAKKKTSPKTKGKAKNKKKK